MNTTKTLVNSAIAVAVGLSLGMMAPTAQAAKQNMEKCYGVSKAHLNDCGAKGKHGCAGQATKHGDTHEWIYVPKGTCKKIVGGSTTAGAKKT